MDFLHIHGIESLPAFLTSLALGLLIGLERERTPSAKAGLRTFGLVALFGTLTALLGSKIASPWLLIAGLLAVAAMIIGAYRNHPEDADPGTTTVAALLLCYCLGAMVWFGQAKLAVMLAIGVTMLLYFKPELRGLSQRLSRRDLIAALQFCVLTFIILPILPDQDYGPYSAFNPHQAWWMVVLISGISLAGYAALHLVGTRYGAPLLGFLGGLVSSTATTMIYAKHGKKTPALMGLAAMVILIASMVVLVRLSVVSAIVAFQVLPLLLPVFGSALLAGILVVAYRWRRREVTDELLIPDTSNPAELHTALGFGALYVAVLLGAAWMEDMAGSQGLYVLALVSGLTDVDAITLSSLRLFNLKQLSETQTVTAIAIAYLSNMGFKFGLVVSIGGAPLARQVAAGFAAIAVTIVVALCLL